MRIKNNVYISYIKAGVKSLLKYGFSYTYKKAKRKIKNIIKSRTKLKRIFTKGEKERQEKFKFEKDIKFSIVVPLYNTPKKFLIEMIESVIAQTYSNWELCMADASDSMSEDVNQICNQYARKDSRIKYRKLEKNLGISENTNASIEVATGDYIGLLDHDDMLHPAALFEVMSAICQKNADFVYTDEATFRKSTAKVVSNHFKSDYAPDTFRSYNYICHFSVFKRTLLDKVGLFNMECDGSQDYDMFLRLTEQAECIVHIPKILYYWRIHKESVASSVEAKPYCIEAAHKALNMHLKRMGLEGEIMDVVPSVYRIKYSIKGTPKISILIPNYEHLIDLQKCLDSIFQKTTYPNYEIIIIENNSESAALFSYYEEIQNTYENVKVINWDGTFNYSSINNFGAKYATGDYIVLLNNDTEIISTDWIQEMLMFAQRKDVGAVGAMLYYPNDTIQHAGVVVGLGGFAGHVNTHLKRGDYGDMFRTAIAQNLSAVTGACMMIPRAVWEAVCGLDEDFTIALNDVDLCMRIRKAGYLVVWTPFAEMYHYESKSRGYEDTEQKKKRFSSEINRFKERWHKELAEGDPYYNLNLID